MVIPLSVIYEAINLSPLGFLMGKISSLQSSCLRVEMAHHRISGSNILIYYSDSSSSSNDHDESVNGLSLSGCLIDLITESGESVHPFDELELFSSDYFKMHNNDPFILFSRAIEDATSSYPFFYASLEYHGDKKTWILNLSLNSHKGKDIENKDMGRDLSVSLFSAIDIIKNMV